MHSVSLFDVQGEADRDLSEAQTEVVREVVVPNDEGMHARPVMRFVDLAMKFRSSVSVTNMSHSDETVDGKSAMQMMLLEATKGSVLKIGTRGADAMAAADALAGLVSAGFGMESTETSA